MDEKQTQQQHRQHFNLSEATKQKLEELTAKRYPGRQRRQSQLIEDLITEAFTKERGMNIATTGMQEPDRLAPSTHEVLRLAQQEAVRMQAPEVYPEHILLGVVAQGENKAAKMLCNSGMDMQAIRIRATEVFGFQYTGSDRGDLPLSKESHECIEWAISQVTRYMQSSLVLPEHLVLGILRHPRMRGAFLTPFSSSIDILQGYLTREMGPALLGYMEQSLSINEVEQQSPMGFTRRALGAIERPTITLATIKGYDETKREMQEVVEFLRKSEHSSNLKRGGMIGVLLVSPPRKFRTFLVQAVAGEAAVPLVSISISALVEVLVDISTGKRRLEDFNLPVREYNLLKSGRGLMRGLFDQAKQLSPCIILIDDIDAAASLDTNEEHERLLKQLLVEMDKLIVDERQRVALIATARNSDSLNPALFRPGRFDRRVVLGRPGQFVHVWDDQTTIPATQSTPSVVACPSCKRPIQLHWKHCVFCGSSLARVCPHCGAPRPEVEDARFCFECGSPLMQEGEESPKGVVKQVLKDMEKTGAETDFSVGQNVRVIDGPFTEYTGTITAIDVEQRKLTVLVTFFGREMPVELDFLQVENI